MGSGAQLCPTLRDPMDCSPPGSSVHGISQARTLEQVAISFSRGSSQPRDRTHVLLRLLHWQVDSLPLSHLGNGGSWKWPSSLCFCDKSVHWALHNVLKVFCRSSSQTGLQQDSWIYRDSTYQGMKLWHGVRMSHLMAEREIRHTPANCRERF